MLKTGLVGFIVTVAMLAPLPVAAHAGEVEAVWETAGFKNPESVVYDDQRDLLYVSNVNGQPDDKNGKGFIATVAMDGTIKQRDWVTGLNAPKGLAIHGDRLYAADIDTLVEIDIASGKILNRYVVGDARFLNDVAAADDGSIYVSDMMLNRIHRLENGVFSIWLENDQLENPNGLQVVHDNLVVGSWGVMTDGFATDTPGHLKTVALADKSISSIGSGEPIGNLDGVEVDLEGDFYVTDWMAGKLLHVTPDGEVEQLLDLNQGSADLEYIPGKSLILIPMMNDGTLQTYRIHAD